ncbi:MAG: hypothetical protein AAFX99_35565, partial [Myxococcota bacterium]
VIDSAGQDKGLTVAIVGHRDREPRYVTRSELEALAVQLQAPLAEEYALEGDTLEAQVEALEAMLRDTDLEGAVITFEGRDLHGRPAVLHRVKVKGAHYLSLMRQMTRCTYARTRQLLQLNPELRTWEALRDHLMNLGSDEVPEEILGAYRSHLETWQARQKELGQLAQLAQEAFQAIEAHMGAPPEQRDAAYGEWRKMFARWLHTHAPEVRGLLFQAADGKLDVERLERMFGDDPQGLATAAGQLRDVTRSIAPG